jgi:hypothetical protein
MCGMIKREDIGNEKFLSGTYSQSCQSMNRVLQDLSGKRRATIYFQQVIIQDGSRKLMLFLTDVGSKMQLHEVCLK